MRDKDIWFDDILFVIVNSPHNQWHRYRSAYEKRKVKLLKILKAVNNCNGTSLYISFKLTSCPTIDK